MNFPVRKPNRLKGYDYNQNGAYFITICTKDKEKLLCQIENGGIFDFPKVTFTEYGKILNETIRYIHENNDSIKIDKYVIMPNHVHLILFLNGASGMPHPTSRENECIPKCISSMKRYVNRKTGKNIFQRSFHDHIIRNEADYHRIWEYIDTNPFKWKEDCFYAE